jgi:hypothetical protein
MGSQDDWSNDGFETAAKEEPSWFIPLTVFAITGVLSLGFLAYYFGPSLGDLLGTAPAPTETAQPVNVVIAGTHYEIPENYTRSEAARRGGEQSSIALHALLPELSPYVPEEADAFIDNGPESRVLNFEIEKYKAQFSETDRFEKIYKRLVENPEGTPGPHGLQVYRFGAEKGYKDEELFVRSQPDGSMTLLRCFKTTEAITSPGCRRDLQISDGIGLNYRFKRAHLASWREIDSGVRLLVKSFEIATPAAGH